MNKYDKTDADSLAETFINFMKAVTDFMKIQMEINKDFRDFIELHADDVAEESRRWS